MDLHVQTLTASTLAALGGDYHMKERRLEQCECRYRGWRPEAHEQWPFYFSRKCERGRSTLP